MFCKVVALLALTTPVAFSSDVPPHSLVLENVKKASVIVRGEIESAESIRSGVTVAHFKVRECYRGVFKPGDKLSYASFREGDRYSDKLIHSDLIVFLRKRARKFAPPDLETATDLSEFSFSDALKSQLPKHDGEHQ